MEMNFSQTSANNQTGQQDQTSQGGETSQTGEQPESDFSSLATLAARLYLIASTITNTTKDDKLLVLAATLGLIAAALLVKAANLEAVEQQVAPGQTTFANNLKLIGTKGVFISASILYLALLIEVTIKQQAKELGIPAVPTIGAAGVSPVGGGSAAFLV